ncbi:MAG TPA: YwiC-like family protein [Thermoanaerobaculia bacterium]|nr:YwiC-like family protein [Thermoanaerobaculia bacterium]
MSGGGLARRSVALPADHGSWVFLLTPLIVGLVAGGRWSGASAALVVAALAGFLLRQPVTVAVKVASGRRSRGDLPAAVLWSAVYTAVGAVALLLLVRGGFGGVLALAVPGVAIFLWYLWLVSRRDERRQLALELLATGVLALAAPAALWVGLGRAAPVGWLLWLLMWAQSATSILYVYLRLEQRSWRAPRGLAARLRAAAPALVATGLFAGGTLALSAAGVVARWLFLAPAVQLGECVAGALRPATGARPAAIGKRQLAVSALFTGVFAVAWVLGDGG